VHVRTGKNEATDQSTEIWNWKDFKEFIELLNEHKVKYLVIGGYAVNFHGYPR